MMTYHHAGGCAFPAPTDRFETREPGTGRVNGYTEVSQPGMSLLDYFAGQALVAMGTWIPLYDYPEDTDDHNAKHHRSRARFAYEQASAMLQERARILAATEPHPVSNPVDE